MKTSKARAIDLIDQKIAQFEYTEKQISKANVFVDEVLHICYETGALLAELFSVEDAEKFLSWALPDSPLVFDSWLMEAFKSEMVDTKKRKYYVEGILRFLNTYKDVIIYGDIVHASVADGSLTTNDQSSSFRNLNPGMRIGNYVISSQLGVGGIGAVYLARHRFLNQIVAIKVHDFFPLDKYVSIAFLRATNYLSQLNHPNIVYLHNYGFEGGRAYQVMEYVNGPSLIQIIPDRQTKAWTDRCLEYFTQLLSALLYAHNCKYFDLDGTLKQGIIHGDIKPHNILLDQSKDIVKLADFMIPDVQAALGAKNFDFQIATSAEYGTPAYMPPEQKEGKVTQQTDIFSLGVTMYQLVTGYAPYEEGAEAMWQGVTPQQINPYVPDWLGKMIVKAIQRKPADRFKTIAEMIRILTRNQGQERSSLMVNVKEWIMGDQINSQIGDISNVSGQLFIGKFNNVIANLNTSGQTELAETLKILKDAVMASGYLPDDEKQEQVGVICQIGEEVTKPKPNKTLLKMLSDGLMATLRVIPDIANAIAAAGPILTQLHL
jgi:eukaryotic-like serine/threonine-protein kinase